MGEVQARKDGGPTLLSPALGARLVVVPGLVAALYPAPLPAESPACVNPARNLVIEEPCPADSDGDRVVTVAELVRAVKHALHGCPGSTPTRTRTPRPTETPGSPELEVLETLGEELVPVPGRFGCTSSAVANDGSFRMTCELPLAFATVAIRRYPDSSAALAAFEERRDGRPLSSFHGYGSFEYTGVVLQDIPTHTVVWVAERWVFESTQVTVFDGVTVSVDNANRVFELAIGAGFVPGDS